MADVGRGILAIAGCLALAGCINLGGGKPPAQLLTLGAEAAAPVGPGITAKPGDAIVVEEPGSPQSLAVTQVPVRISDSSIAYLKGAVWADRPTRLFRGLLAETLRARGTRMVFEDSQPDALGGTRLSGELVAFGYDAPTGSVVVRFDALRSTGKSAVSMRRFEAVEHGVAPTAAAVGPALGRAANDVARQVADWVG